MVVKQVGEPFAFARFGVGEGESERPELMGAGLGFGGALLNLFFEGVIELEKLGDAVAESFNNPGVGVWGGIFWFVKHGNAIHQAWARDHSMA